MGRSKTGRNNPRPLQSAGMSTEGFREGNEPEGRLRTLRSRRQYLTVRRTLGFEIDGLEFEQRGSMLRSLFKLDTWPRLRGSKGDAGGSFVCAPAFENQNQIHYSIGARGIFLLLAAVSLEEIAWLYWLANNRYCHRRPTVNAFLIKCLTETH